MTTNQTIGGVPRGRDALVVLVETFRDSLHRGKQPTFSAGDLRFFITEFCELRALLDAPLPCAHEWTDDGAHLLVCTACGAQEDHDPGWRDMETAPTDGTMVRLLVEFDEHSTEDAEQAITIGANNLDNDEEDAWRFAGWCWTHDHFTEGKGTPVGWLPMLDDPVSKPAAQPQGEPVAWQYRVSAGPQTGWSLWHDGKGEEFKRSYQVETRPLYAEQPALVAVVLPERSYASDEDQQSMTDYEIGLGHGACEMWDKIKALNPSL